MNWSVLLGAKAEVVLGFLLLVRHRTVRLVCAVTLALAALSLLPNLGLTSGKHQPETMLFVAGSLAAVAGSRLLAPGGALAASRQVAERCWLAPLGRLVGALFLVVPVVSIVAFSLNAVEYGPVRMSIVTAVYVAAVASGAMALAPAMGATAATVAAMIVVWSGVVPASDLHRMLVNWPLLHRALVGSWYLFPLHWRACRLLDTGNLLDALVLSGWIVIAVTVAALVSTPVRPGIRQHRAGKCRH